jgi:hypothetical protein
MNLEADMLWRVYGRPDVRLRCSQGCDLLFAWRMPDGHVGLHWPEWKASPAALELSRRESLPGEDEPEWRPEVIVERVGSQPPAPRRYRNVGGRIVAAEESVIVARAGSDFWEPPVPEQLSLPVILACDHALRVPWEYRPVVFFDLLRHAEGEVVLSIPERPQVH